MGNSMSQAKNLTRDFTRPDKLQQEPFQLLSDNQVLEYSPDRFNFYNQLWDSLTGPDSTVVDRVLSVEMKNRKQFEDTQRSIQDVAKSVTSLKRISDEQSQNGGGTWYANKLREFNDAEADGPAGYSQKKGSYDGWKSNPVFSSEVEKVSATDRVVFIAMTFILRTITLYLVEWGINNRMITSFEKAFTYYFLIYVSFIILWALLVNINKDDLMFRLIFYYINFNNSKGMTRVIVHCAIQLLLLPIPFILKESSTSNASAFLSFEERRNVINTLSSFTMFVWILTSTISLRV